MSDHAVAIGALCVSIVTLLAVLLDRYDRLRYKDFLVKIHEDAAAEEERLRGRYASNMYSVQVSEGDLDLAFRALAEDILDIESGDWLCRPARFTRSRP